MLNGQMPYDPLTTHSTIAKKLFVLSGGGARGFAHLGVLKALYEKGVAPLEIAGTSAGAIAAAFIANGFTIDEVKEIFLNKSNQQLLKWNFFSGGLLSLEKVAILLKRNLRFTRFEELPITLHISATNFAVGGQTIFSTGDLIDPVLAACSIPGLFPPLYINHIPYVDGGLSNNLPVEPFIQRKKDVIAIYVNPIGPYNSHSNIAGMIDRALHMSFREMITRSAKDCYLFIEPPGIEKFGLLELRKFPSIFETAYEYSKGIVLPGT